MTLTRTQWQIIWTFLCWGPFILLYVKTYIDKKGAKGKS